MWSNLLHYFQNLEQRPLERLAILVGGLLFFWIIEGAIPLIPLRYKKNKLRHAGVNLPAVGVGIMAGNYLHDRISATQFTIAVQGCLLLSGIALLAAG